MKINVGCVAGMNGSMRGGHTEIIKTGENVAKGVKLRLKT